MQTITRPAYPDSACATAPGPGNRTRLTRLVPLLAVWLVLCGSCSQEKKTWSSLAWHNTLARYNAYFLAREKMSEFEADQLSGYKDNYNRVLDVYPFPPLGSGASANAIMDEVIKKASLPAQRHKNSRWVDDCYILIGKARFYKEDWENAVQTFKFVNTKFKDKDARHLAVIWLLNTYTRMGDISNAKSVIAYLKKETLSRENLREGAMAFAFYYQKRKDYAKMRSYMAIAVELTPRSRKKGRLAFALGQLHQKAGAEPEAYTAYKTVLKCWPGFDLEFFTRMNMAQVIPVADEKQIRAIRKNFRRMTRDLKYEEYYDKIYYEMALFEIKQNDLTRGLQLLRTSLRQTKGNGRQKPYTFLKLADLHYSPLRNYVWAKNYYDSTIAGLDTADDQYKMVARRQKYLKDFVGHYLTIQREDSLQKLARMDTTRLLALIDQKIREEKEKEEKEEKLARKRARELEAAGGAGGADFNPALDNLSPAGGGAPGGTAGGWYFSNPQVVANGRRDFRSKWGTRKLEDNWRRSTKQADFDNADAADADTAKSGGKAGDDSQTAGKDGKDGEANSGKDGKAGKPMTLAEQRQPYLKDIPSTPALLEASNGKLRVALLEAGKIYDQQLEEPLLAIDVLERCAREFPSFEKTPEALYNLCLIYRRMKREADFNRCRDLLVARFPESLFTKLILNPNYLQENKQRNELIAGLYRTAYEQYKNSMFIEASNGIAAIRSQYPNSDFEDKLALLSALITAKTVDLPSYKAALKKFLDDFPKSNLQEFARKCLEIAEKGGAPPAAPADTASAAAGAKTVTFNESGLDKKQFFLVLIPSLNVPESALKNAFSDFNQKFYTDENLQVTTLPFGDGKHVMLKIQELPTRIRALYYLKKVQETGPFKKDFPGMKPVYLLVTPENLQLLYKSKAIDAYAIFFARNYNLKKELEQSPAGSPR